MATIRKMIYRCDSCAKDVPAPRDLVQLRVEKGQHGRYGNGTLVGAKADLCAECENDLLINLKMFFGAEVYELLRRKPPRVKKQK